MTDLIQFVWRFTIIVSSLASQPHLAEAVAADFYIRLKELEALG
jgi:hypothetical protein